MRRLSEKFNFKKKCLKFGFAARADVHGVASVCDLSGMLYPHEIGLGILSGLLRRWMSDEISPPAGIFVLLIQPFPMQLDQVMKKLRRSKILVAQATFPTEAPEERNVAGSRQAPAMSRGLGSSEASHAQGAGMMIADFRIGSA